MCGVRIAALLPASRWRGLGGPAGDIAVAHSQRIAVVVVLTAAALAAVVEKETEVPRVEGIGRVLRTGPVAVGLEVREQAH